MQGLSMSDRNKVILAVVGSLVIHILVILAGSKVVALGPDVSSPTKDEAPPELTMLDTPPPEPQKQERQYLRTNDDQKTDKKPDQSFFESDKDTANASEKPAEGSAPVPTQQGKETPDIGFKDEQYSLADKGSTFAPNPGQQAAAQQEQKAQDKKEESQETPTPAPTPVPTPTPDVIPTDEELAMLRPTPTPRPTPSRQAERMPQRQSLPHTAYRQEQRASRLQGNINNHGRSSIAAIGTPKGRFEKAVQDAVGSRWYYYVRERSDLINIGTVEIRFYVRPDGKVEDVHVIRNSSNETLASTSLQSIIEANIPPMPGELAPLLTSERMEFTMSFNFTY
jgi:outer membrane biosynthesis protein TonB